MTRYRILPRWDGVVVVPLVYRDGRYWLQMAAQEFFPTHQQAVAWVREQEGA